MDRDRVIELVREQVTWWIKLRTKKILQSQHETMEINPFLAPLICALHGVERVDELAEFVIGGHFYIGHGTGFGKLIDEKILPHAFGTKKLSARYRQAMNLKDPAFDNIDHIVERDDGIYLLSQKAGKWTIQLGQAIELNRSFQTLIRRRDAGEISFKKIVVATFYGTDQGLTDKYRILRGITTGASHDVEDVTADVEVLAGRKFWSWIGGSDETQEWVMTGILRAIQQARAAANTSERATEHIEQAFADRFAQIGTIDSVEDWIKLLKEVNT